MRAGDGRLSFSGDVVRVVPILFSREIEARARCRGTTARAVAEIPVIEPSSDFSELSLWEVGPDERG
jgi:hypothetical protein